MKKLIKYIIFISIIFLVVIYNQNIVVFIFHNFIYKKNASITISNNYYKNSDYLFIQNTKDFIPQNKQDIMNIIYTGLNSGNDEFIFYCTDKKYESCLDDVKYITNDNVLLSAINNYLHPFNSYSAINIHINNLGEIKFEIKKLYSQEEINILNHKIDEIYNSIIKENMTEKEKIKMIHDYIINNTVYDKNKADDISNPNSSPYKSNMAIGVLINGYGICGGYTDSMALFLNKMNIKNYKISSETHIWNYVNIDGNWFHLDLTWDDPVVNTGQNFLLDTFFLITTDELLEKDTTQHIFDKNNYLETKNF